MLAALAVITLTLPVSAKSNAEAQTVNQAIDGLASDIVSHLENKELSISVDTFGGPAGSSTGRLLQLKLQKALEKRRLERPLAGGTLAIRGSFSVSFEHDGAIILIEAKLVDRAGKGVGEFRKQAFASGAKSLEEIAKLFPANFDLTAKSKQTLAGDGSSNNGSVAPTEKENVANGNAIKQKLSILSPTFVFQKGDHTRISPEKNSQFHLELLVKRRGEQEFQALEFADASGIPFAELKDGDTFQVQIYNFSRHPIGVKLLIDGINSLALSRTTEIKQHGCWLIDANSVAPIKGWYIDSEYIRPLLVTSQDRDLSLPDPGDVGTVSALVFKADIVEGPLEELSDQYASTRNFPIHVTAGDLQANSTEETRAIFDSELLSSLSFRYTNPTDLPAGADFR